MARCTPLSCQAFRLSKAAAHKYLMVVVDHDSDRLVWAAAGHDRATLQGFFDLLGPERAAKIRLVSADAAEWIGDRAPARTRPSAWTRSTAAGGRPRPSTSYAAGSGTGCAA